MRIYLRKKNVGGSDKRGAKKCVGVGRNCRQQVNEPEIQRKIATKRRIIWRFLHERQKRDRERDDKKQEEN